MDPSQPDAVRRSIDAVWRLESARLIGGLVRLVGDLQVAEDLAHEAMVAALESWPATGIPDNAGAWLMTTAKRRGIDLLRRRQMLTHKHEAMAQARAEPGVPDVEAAIDEDVGDDTLRLILVACHPVLSTDARVSLTLRLLGGLTTEEIARAFLTTEPTIAQRIVRAKRTIAAAHVPFDVPTGPALRERVSSVLEVIYLVFNEGYAATRGDDVVRRDLCRHALRLGRVLAARVPDDAEAHGLVALMHLQSSRFAARVDADGDPILLDAQDRGRWDRMEIRLGLEALGRAESLEAPLGPYALQAGIAACHARAPTFAATDWPSIVAPYDALAQLRPSPVIELNRAVAISYAFDPAEALALVDELAEAPALRGYHLLPAVRGDLLLRLGCRHEARHAFEQAAFEATHPREKALLLSRAKACG